MPSCFVCGRSRIPLTKLQNIIFQRFSADPKIQEKWFDFFKENGLDVYKITKHSLICSSHFDPSLFITNKYCRTLSKTSVLSIVISKV
ncbi:uncharacterized protein LOC112684627 [Sipha flava]|uniref:Uncharacterized protein LOC112684627 n=1 Tax=Sipha flava TaxID=143950 RepID=A0A8B8FM65_9HEMI|nr:uncharacterized protein LOC112684627 [Sipha flava]